MFVVSLHSTGFFNELPKFWQFSNLDRNQYFCKVFFLIALIYWHYIEICTFDIIEERCAFLVIQKGL